MEVRRRTADDLDGCVELLRAIHALDGYPPWLGGGMRDFLDSPDALAAWVAVAGDELVGHVALHRRGPQVAMERAAAVTGLTPDRLAAVARLLVGPPWRRQGLGRMLLTEAAEEARSRGLRPMLDVATRFTAAIALYESCGWTPAGPVTFRLGDEVIVHSSVYVGPG